MMQKSDSFVLLDVRTEQEFLDNHITGAILIPVQELENIAVSKLPEKNTFFLFTAGQISDPQMRQKY